MAEDKIYTLPEIEEEYNKNVSQISNLNQMSLENLEIIESAIDVARNRYNEAELESIEDFIISKYNMCSLLCHSRKTDRHEYIPILKTLNSVFSSKLYSGNDTPISVLDKLIALNFRTHNYETALQYIKKAIEKEDSAINKALSIKEVKDRFMRRWRAILCCEYIGLNKLHGVHGQKDAGIPYLENAIELLIGKRLFDASEDDYLDLPHVITHDTEIFGLSHLIDYDNIIEKEEIGWHGYCLAKQVEIWLRYAAPDQEELSATRQGSNFEKLQSQCYEDITHALAHCLSEYVKYQSEGTVYSTRDYCLLRVAEILINKLGSKYVTCHATLLIERRKYFSALSLLERAKWPVIADIDFVASTQEASDIECHSTKEENVNSVGESLTIPRGGGSCLPEAESSRATAEACNKPSTFTEHTDSLLNTPIKDLPSKLYDHYSDFPIEHKKKLNEIALIEFYRWYYSVFSKKVDADISKIMFDKYCKESHDPIAATYYSVVNLKGLLIKGFTDIWGWGKDQSNSMLYKEIRDAHVELVNSRPGPTIHADIWREWELLDIAYKAFRILIDSQNDMALLCHRLYNLLVLPGNNRDSIETEYHRDNQSYFKEVPHKTVVDQPNQHENPQEIDCETKKSEKADKAEETVAYRVTTELGSFIYRGKAEYLDDMLNRYNTKQVTEPILEGKIKKFLQDELTCDISNVILVANPELVEKDFNFLRTVTSSDAVAHKEAKHSVFIDLSALSSKSLEQLMQHMSSCGYNSLEAFSDEPDNSRVIFFHDRQLAMQFCITFSCLERILKRLHTPLDSNLISPISEDETYVDQADSNVLSLIHPDLLRKEEGSCMITPVQTFQQGGSIVDSCITLQNETVNHGKRLDLCFLRNNLSDLERLTHIVVVCIDKMGGTNDVNVAYLDAFEIRQSISYTKSFLYSDTVEHYNDTHLESHLIQMMKRMYEGKSHRRNHTSRDLCTTVPCKSFYSELSNSNAHYKYFRDCLYQTTGMLIPEKSNVLLQCTKKSNSSNEYVVFLLSDLRNKHGELFDVRTCELLQNYNDYLQEIVGQGMIIRQEPPMDELIKKIKPYKKGNKYVFVSFRSNGNDEFLCRPVLNDIHTLQQSLDELTDGSVGIYFDANYVSDLIKRQLSEAIKDPDCIGAIVYASAEYFLPYENGEELKPDPKDFCHTELTQLIAKREELSDSPNPFFIFPVVFSTPLYEKNHYTGVEDFVKKIWGVLKDNNRPERVKAIRALFGYDSDTDAIDDKHYIMQFDGSHYTKNNNLKNALVAAGAL